MASAPSYISFRGVDFQYTSQGKSPTWILKDLNLEIARGEFYVLLGPSGCGKTTALTLLAGFEHQAAGTVSVDGRTITKPGVDRVVIFQGDDSLYGWLTAQENVEFGLKMAGMPASQRREKALRQLEFVGLKGQGHKFPSQLSGGMKQRIQIARALVCDSPILLMDEPFAALDAQTRAVLQDELTAIQRKIASTVLFITHDIGEAIILADRIGIMRSGPASALKEEITIDLPRPRRRGDPAFGALYDRIHATLSEEVDKVMRREQAAA
ncbi:ABC transporter ATP-binding protein [Reyranella sp. CPCC 100927]|uniref:ABC transporter ATP-binding protein n=1 Tax=Reyranella sp. CPCC 100927 TaxID=2599616 RepID=UPI0011B53CC0|nr:ABC transporter ATP-binding protein [Reyranella sp. CPCC 100927]TWT13950.1 ABC transporter ATP-binding protein [Reyranella sp. CPCC 100927]